jgi:GTP-binding protein YchF
MKLVITGLSNSGKTTVFNALTGQNIETTIYPSTGGEAVYGVVKVPDPRIDKLAGIYKPKKITHATINYVDYIGITKSDTEQNRKVFDLIKDADAIVQVVRAFENESVAHPMNKVSPLNDIETLELELVLGDLELVEKRISRMGEDAKKGKKINKSEEELLIKCKDALEKGIPLREINFDIEEQKTMRHLQFVSIKPEVVVLNVGVDELNKESSLNIQKKAEKYFDSKKTTNNTRVVSLCGKIEMEIAQMSGEDARAFLDEYGIKEPALNKLINVSYNLLGLISFFTVGPDEVRAWTITNGTDAQNAAGKIHSDIQKGFIRAEVVGYDDFVSFGEYAADRYRECMRLEGKTYKVKDGDIMNFRFNV